MMLDISFADLRKGAMQYVPVGLVAGGILLFELIAVASTWTFSKKAMNNRAAETPDPTALTNTEGLGQILYTDYIYAFQIAGLVLLVAMIGAIVLTHRRRPGVRRQKVAEQQARTRDESMEVQKVTPGTGV